MSAPNADEIALGYTWYLNGVELPEHDRTIAAESAIGDEVKCVVTCLDGTDDSQATSDSVTVACPCSRQDHVAAIPAHPPAQRTDADSTDESARDRGGYRGPVVGMADPAAVYCAELGYEYRIVGTPTGQKGICVFPDGKRCDAWAFLEGRCGQGWSYCARQGHRLIIKADGKDPFSEHYAVCVSKEGAEIGSITELTGLAEKATGHCVDSRPEATNGGAIPPGSGAVGEAAPAQSLPSSLDWRNHDGINWMTSVKDQGVCGSCWAFAAIGSAEAMFNARMLNPDFDLDISEEYIVCDCLTSSPAGGDHCCGGSTLDAFNYMMISGIPDENCLPYISGQDCNCPEDPQSGIPTCNSSTCAYSTMANCSESTCSDRCSDYLSRLIFAGSSGTAPPSNYKTALISNGPLAVSLAMDGSFQGGIYKCNDSWDTDPSQFYTNHAVGLVGYNDTGQYWICKNSWGNTWNGDGYFKVGYGECFIDTPPVGPNTKSQVIYAGPPTWSCGSTITQDTKLWGALVDCWADGIYIGANNITLDCQGATIDGSGSFGYGIWLNDRSNVTIKNCNIKDFDVGIKIDGGSNNSILDCTIDSNVSRGVYAVGGSGHVVTGNTVTGHGQEGIRLESNSGNTVSENTASHNQTGINLSNSHSNDVNGNTAEYNDLYGILANYYNTKIRNNECNHNSTGIYIQYTNDFKIYKNSCKENGVGIHVENTVLDNNNMIHHNDFADNSGIGVMLYNSKGNTFHLNNVNGNGNYGAKLMQSSQSNVFYENNFYDNVIENAHEDSSSTGNSWDSNGVGNFWDDYDWNSGYLGTYAIPGPGDGIDRFPLKQKATDAGSFGFDEGSGGTAYGTSGCLDNGEIHGATWEEGICGTALLFDGVNDYVGVPHSECLAISGPFSVQAYIKTAGAASYHAIVDKYEYQPGNQKGFTLYLNNGRLRLTIYCGVNGSKNAIGTTDLRDNEWHHVRGEWDGTYARVYVDEVVENESPWGFPPAVTTADLGIGMRLSCWGGCMNFSGLIDEVEISESPNLVAEFAEYPPGWSMISVPSVPVNPDPEVVFAGNMVSGALHRYDHDAQQYRTYYDFNPSEFGLVRRGDGYWFYCLDAAGCQLLYDAYGNVSRLKIDLPTPGWYMISGYDSDVPFEELLVSDGVDTLPFQEVANIWIQDPFIGYDSAGGQYYNAGLLPTDNDHFLRAWQGYWLHTFVDNLRLIVPTIESAD